MAGDHRERIGADRNDGKFLARHTRRVAFERLADEYGIPTNDTATGPWRKLVLQAVTDAQPKGKVN